MPASKIELFRRVSRLTALAVFFALLAVATFVSSAAATRRVLIVSLDGLRPDVAMRADMPALRSVMARGSFTMYAMTTDVAITLPSHTSMLTGVIPTKHGITYNADPRTGDLPEPLWPTLFDVAHRAGFTTAMCVGKSKFSVLAKASTLDSSFVPARGAAYADSQVAEVAERWIRHSRPQLLFVHLPGLDAVGHAKGWGSPEQVAAAVLVDRAFARVLRALERAGLTDSTLIIVSSDHGGVGRSHGGLDARSRLIPWLAAGPGVRRNYDLTQIQTLQVHTEDTFATAAAWLGLTLAQPVDGREVTEILEPSGLPR